MSISTAKRSPSPVTSSTVTPSWQPSMKQDSTSPERASGTLISDVVDLDVTGMTCAACAARIERKLNKLDGVEASVNYATERAHITLADRPVDVAELIATIEATGYGAHEPTRGTDPPD